MVWFSNGRDYNLSQSYSPTISKPDHLESDQKVGISNGPVSDPHCILVFYWQPDRPDHQSRSRPGTSSSRFNQGHESNKNNRPDRSRSSHQRSSNRRISQKRNRTHQRHRTRSRSRSGNRTDQKKRSNDTQGANKNYQQYIDANPSTRVARYLG